MVAVMAHEDDDLLFVGPVVRAALAAGEAVTIVYVTAGDGQRDEAYVEARELGLEAAYSAVTGDRSWDCGWIVFEGHAMHHCRLSQPRLSLVFLRYPDGNITGEWPGSLLHLWQGDIDRVATVAPVGAQYDQDGLIGVVAAVMQTAQPARIHTLDFTAAHGHDHSDHLITGAIATLAAARAGLTAPLTGHRGYNTDQDPINVSDAEIERGEFAFGHYSACVESGCGRCFEVACTRFLDSYHQWIRRHYTVARVLPPATGRLAVGERCLATQSDGTLVMAPCATAPGWQLASDGTLRDGEDRCIAVDERGNGYAATVEACATGDAARERWLLDDEGGLWSMRAPHPEADMSGRHLVCLRDDASVALCGNDPPARWSIGFGGDDRDGERYETSIIARARSRGAPRSCSACASR